MMHNDGDVCGLSSSACSSIHTGWPCVPGRLRQGIFTGRYDTIILVATAGFSARPGWNRWQATCSLQAVELLVGRCLRRKLSGCFWHVSGNLRVHRVALKAFDFFLPVLWRFSCCFPTLLFFNIIGVMATFSVMATFFLGSKKTRSRTRTVVKPRRKDKRQFLLF